MTLRRFAAPLSRSLERLAVGRRGAVGLFAASFLASSIIPFPIELIFLPAVIWRRDRAILFTTVALAGCVFASCGFYAVGWYLFDTLGQDVAGWLGIDQDLRDFERDLQSNGFWLIASISFLPLPLQVATLGSGAFGYPFGLFLAAIVVSRGLRFYGLMLIAMLAGPFVLQQLRSVPTIWQAFGVLASLGLIAGLVVVL